MAVGVLSPRGSVGKERKRHQNTALLLGLNFSILGVLSLLCSSTRHVHLTEIVLLALRDCWERLLYSTATTGKADASDAAREIENGVDEKEPSSGKRKRKVRCVLCVFSVLVLCFCQLFQRYDIALMEELAAAFLCVKWYLTFLFYAITVNAVGSGGSRAVEDETEEECSRLASDNRYHRIKSPAEYLLKYFEQFVSYVTTVIASGSGGTCETKDNTNQELGRLQPDHHAAPPEVQERSQAQCGTATHKRNVSPRKYYSVNLRPHTLTQHDPPALTEEERYPQIQTENGVPTARENGTQTSVESCILTPREVGMPAREGSDARTLEEGGFQGREESRGMGTMEESSTQTQDESCGTLTIEAGSRPTQEESGTQTQEENRTQVQEESGTQTQEENRTQVQEESGTQTQEENRTQVQEESGTQTQEENRTQIQEESGTQTQEENRTQVQEESGTQTQEENRKQIQEESDTQTQEENRTQIQGRSSAPTQKESGTQTQGTLGTQVQEAISMHTLDKSRTQTQNERNTQTQAAAQVNRQTQVEIITAKRRERGAQAQEASGTQTKEAIGGQTPKEHSMQKQEESGSRAPKSLEKYSLTKALRAHADSLIQCNSLGKKPKELTELDARMKVSRRKDLTHFFLLQNPPRGFEPETLIVAMMKTPVQQPPTSSRLVASDQELANEMERLRTFSRFDPPAGVFVLPVAASGFFLSPAFQNPDNGNNCRAEATVECVFCHIVVLVSRFKGRQVTSLHAELSPGCRFLRGEDVGNMSVAHVGEVSSADFFRKYAMQAVPLPLGIGTLQDVEATASQQQLTSANTTASTASSAPAANQVVVTQTARTQTAAAAAPQTMRSQADVAQHERSGTATTNRPQTSAPTSIPFQTSTVLTTSVALDGSEHNVPPSSSSSSSASPGDRGRSTVSSANTTGDSGDPRSSGRERQMVTYVQLGIYAERPKRPDMAVTLVRINTYSNWPHRDTHPPEEMAAAGLYFTGYEDMVRCFYCKGGLKHWDGADRPWTEHSRWFPHCPFINLCKGAKFVQAVQNLNNTNTLPIITEEDALREVRRLEEEEMRNQGPQMVLNNLPEASPSGDPNCDALASVGIHLDADVTEASIQELAERLSEENEQMAHTMRCKMCQDKDVQVLFLPCGHLVACAQCAPAIRNCAICRQTVKGYVRVLLEGQKDSELLLESQTSQTSTGS